MRYFYIAKFDRFFVDWLILVAGATSPTKLGMSFVIPLWDLKLLKERWRWVGPGRSPRHVMS